MENLKKDHRYKKGESSEDDMDKISKLANTLYLCSSPSSIVGRLYKHYFITDKKYFIKYQNGKSNKIVITQEVKLQSEYAMEETFYKTVDVQKRIKKMLEFKNFAHSLCLRNSEHICRYIMSNVWVSYQMARKGVLRQIFQKHLGPSETRMINVPVLNNQSKGKQTIFEGDTIDAAKFRGREFFLNKSDEDNYNIVYIGVSGAGKKRLINHLFNRKLLVGRSFGETRSVTYIHGTYQSKEFCIVDTLGLCGEDIRSEQIINVIQDSLEANLKFIDKVVIVASKRIEMSHKESIKRFLKFFDYENNFESFVFIYNNSNDDEESEKNENINFLLRELGIDEKVKKLSSILSLENEYKVIEAELTQYRGLILEQNTKRRIKLGSFEEGKQQSKWSLKRSIDHQAPRPKRSPSYTPLSFKD